MTSIKKRSQSLFPFQESDFFEDPFFGFSSFPFNRSKYSQIPPTNITETKTEFKLDISAPGLTKADFKIDIDGGTLIISSEKKEEISEEKEDYKRKEFSYNSFSRSFQLPENVAEEKINAKYDNGMLRISIPKKEGTKNSAKKSIQVE